jgi:hypothetical protein
MSRTPARITQADVARAIRAAQQCGAGVVEIRPDGTIRVVIAQESAVRAPNAGLEVDNKVVL